MASAVTAGTDRLSSPIKTLIRGNSIPLTFSITGKVAVQSWSASRAYLVGDCVWLQGTPNTYYSCKVAGTSGTDEPVWDADADIGDTITDGGVTWEFKGELFLVMVDGVPVEIKKLAGESVIKLMACQPLSISGWRLSVTVKSDPNDADVDAQLAYDFVFPNDADSMVGRYSVEIPPSSTRGLVQGKAYIDLQMEIPPPDGSDSEPSIVTIGIGKVSIVENVTHRTSRSAE